MLLGMQSATSDSVPQYPTSICFAPPAIKQGQRRLAIAMARLPEARPSRLAASLHALSSPCMFLNGLPVEGCSRAQGMPVAKPHAVTSFPHAIASSCGQLRLQDVPA